MFSNSRINSKNFTKLYRYTLEVICNLLNDKWMQNSSISNIFTFRRFLFTKKSYSFKENLRPMDEKKNRWSQNVQNIRKLSIKHYLQCALEHE